MMLTKLMKEQKNMKKNIGDLEKKVLSSLDFMNSKFEEMKLENSDMEEFLHKKKKLEKTFKEVSDQNNLLINKTLSFQQGFIKTFYI